MRPALLILLLFASASTRFALAASGVGEESSDRTVILTDGSIFRGELIELVPGDHVVLRMATGEIKRFEGPQIARISGGRDDRKRIPPASAAPKPTELKVRPIEKQEPPALAPSPNPAPSAIPVRPVASPEDVARETAYSEHIRLGKALYDERDFERAIAEFDAAYRLVPRPLVLYSMARAHQQLGHAAAAMNLYNRYLAEDPAVEPARRAQVAIYMGQLSDNGAAVGEGAQAPAGRDDDEERQNRPTARRNPGLAIGGAVLLGAGYFAAIVAGAIGLLRVADIDPKGPNAAQAERARIAFGTLFVPLAGPFISAGVSDSAQWAAPWILVDGGGQIAGLGMLIAGARKKPTRERTARLSAPSYRAQRGPAQ